MSRHDTDRPHDVPRQISRRQALAKLGLAGLFAYTAPTLLTLSDARAHSRGSRTSFTSVRVRRRVRRRFRKEPEVRFEFEVRERRRLKKPRFLKHKHYDGYYYDYD